MKHSYNIEKTKTFQMFAYNLIQQIEIMSCEKSEFKNGSLVTKLTVFFFSFYRFYTNLTNTCNGPFKGTKKYQFDSIVVLQ